MVVGVEVVIMRLVKIIVVVIFVVIIRVILVIKILLIVVVVIKILVILVRLAALPSSQSWPSRLGRGKGTRLQLRRPRFRIFWYFIDINLIFGHSTLPLNTR